MILTLQILFIVIMLILIYRHEIKARFILYKKKKEHDKKFKTLMEKVDCLKKSGDYHEWIEMDIGNGIECLVCRKTGYCPTINGFFSLFDIELSIKTKEMTNRLKEYRESELERISLEHNIGYSVLVNIIKQVTAIDLKFTKLHEDELNAFIEKNSKRG